MKTVKYRRRLGAVIAIIISGFISVNELRPAVALDAGTKDSDTASSSAEDSRGEELYNASCVVCHGPRATGGIGPRLAGNPVLSNDRAFKKIMSEGRHMMPPLTDTLTAQQMAGIRAWLKTLR